MNFVRKAYSSRNARIGRQGRQEEAWRQASTIFGDPGAHGAGTGAVLEAKNWETVMILLKFILVGAGMLMVKVLKEAIGLIDLKRE